jgi:hypothetical protein
LKISSKNFSVDAFENLLTADLSLLEHISGSLARTLERTESRSSAKRFRLLPNSTNRNSGGRLFGVIGPHTEFEDLAAEPDPAVTLMVVNHLVVIELRRAEAKGIEGVGRGQQEVVVL